MTIRVTSVLAAGLVAAVAALHAGAGRASAMDSMSASGTANCTNAETAMMHGAIMMPSAAAMKPSGNVDKDYAAMVGMHMKAAIAMAKIEVKCGKTPSARAQATKDLEAFQQMQANLSALLDSN